MRRSPLIQLTNIGLTRNQFVVLEDIKLAVYRKQIVTVVGPNGAGKTTLLKVILGLTPTSSGTITRQHNLKVGYMPQRLKLDATLPLSVSRFLHLARHHNNSAIAEALEEVGALRLAGRSLHVLSGGELQRVLLARALLGKPDLLVLDEPVQGVDIKGQKNLYQLITQLKTRLDCGIILVSHDLHLVLAESDQVICLNQHICCAGRPERVVKDPAYTQLFGKELAIYAHQHDHSHDEAPDA
ncbi:MAG: ATP-binding cassette domain-containing protein [Pseudomonadota bacterium]